MKEAVMNPIRLASVCCLAAILGSCKPMTAGDPVDPGNTPKDSAYINVVNHFEAYPGTYSIFLFASTATDAQQASPAVVMGSVNQNASQSFHVPAGQWKLAVQGPSQPITELVESVGSTVWPTQDVKKDLLYHLQLTTDSGSNNQWSFTQLAP